MYWEDSLSRICVASQQDVTKSGLERSNGCRKVTDSRDTWVKSSVVALWKREAETGFWEKMEGFAFNLHMANTPTKGLSPVLKLELYLISSPELPESHEQSFLLPQV